MGLLSRSLSTHLITRYSLARSQLIVHLIAPTKLYSYRLNLYRS